MEISYTPHTTPFPKNVQSGKGAKVMFSYNGDKVVYEPHNQRLNYL